MYGCVKLMIAQLKPDSFVINNVVTYNSRDTIDFIGNHCSTKEDALKKIYFGMYTPRHSFIPWSIRTYHSNLSMPRKFFDLVAFQLRLVNSTMKQN